MFSYSRRLLACGRVDVGVVFVAALLLPGVSEDGVVGSGVIGESGMFQRGAIFCAVKRIFSGLDDRMTCKKKLNVVSLRSLSIGRIVFLSIKLYSFTSLVHGTPASFRTASSESDMNTESVSSMMVADSL